jgi:hypothetical protein
LKATSASGFGASELGAAGWCGRLSVKIDAIDILIELRSKRGEDIALRIEGIQVVLDARRLGIIRAMIVRYGNSRRNHSTGRLLAR